MHRDPTLLRFGDHGTKKCWELLAQKFDRFQTLRNNSEQRITTHNRVCKRTQHVTSKNVESCWPTLLRLFAWGLMFGVQNRLAPANVQKIILTLLDVHSYKTRSVAVFGFMSRHWPYKSTLYLLFVSILRPINFLRSFSYSNRFTIAATFGATASTCLRIFTEGKTGLFPLGGPAWVKGGKQSNPLTL